MQCAVRVVHEAESSKTELFCSKEERISHADPNGFSTSQVLNQPDVVCRIRKTLLVITLLSSVKFQSTVTVVVFRLFNDPSTILLQRVTSPSNWTSRSVSDHVGYKRAYKFRDLLKVFRQHPNINSIPLSHTPSPRH